MTLRTLRGTLARTYLTVDGRSLALCRICLGVVLLVDLVRRVPWIRDFYSNAGLLPNHTVLWRPQLPRIFSVFFMASHVDEAAALFAIAFVCFCCFLVGWRTRLFHLLSFVMTVSLHNRILVAENGGTVALGVLMFWTAFLPLGRRFSVDALVASLRAGAGEQPGDLAAGRLPPPDRRPATSLAVLALLVQLAVIYAFNCVHKSGSTWREGTSVHYVLYQERIVTWLGVWGREHLPFAVTKAATYGTIVIEACAPALILSPIFPRYTRALAIVLLTAMHTGIALAVNLGIFSATMISFYPLLLGSADWDFVSRGVRQRGPRLRVFYDAGCGVCFVVVRLLARLDAFGRITWLSNRDGAALPADVDPELLEQTILVVDAKSGQRWTRADAFARIAAVSPFGWLWAWVLLVPGLRSLAGVAYDAFARKRATVSSWLGLTACAIPEPGHEHRLGPEADTAARDVPWRASLRRWLACLREFGVVFALVVLGADLSVANAAMPRALRWEGRPRWMAEAVMAPRIFEGWGLFAPNAPRSDAMVVVDAVTADGRHVDPYNEVGSRVHALPVDDIPVRLGQDSMFCDYTLRIPREGAYHDSLKAWILRYPERTGRAADAIVSFEATRLEHDSPAPGETQPTNARREVFLRWSALH